MYLNRRRGNFYIAGFAADIARVNMANARCGDGRARVFAGSIRSNYELPMRADEALKEKYLFAKRGRHFRLGERIGESLRGGEMSLLSGGLGAGKTLLTKEFIRVEFDVDEVTSPSFTLVNLYKTDDATFITLICGV
jgi:hypothetical protein